MLRSTCTAVACLLSGWVALMPSVGKSEEVLDLATIRPAFEAFFESRRLTDEPYGQYRMRASDTGPDYYASLDVAISRTVMGEDLTQSLTEQQRTEWIDHLHSYALANGTYSSTYGHHQLHANGMTVGALGPLGGKQLYPAAPLYAPFDQPAEVANYLENSINWASQWSQSHKFWGGLHVYSLSSEATDQWHDTVFNWLDSNIDTNTGWWRTGQQPSSDVQGLGGGAHIWPIYEHLDRDFPEPERVIDRILGMQLASGRFGNGNSGYMDLDALYGLKFMRSLSPEYRSNEIDAAVGEFGDYLAGSINGFLASGPTMHETLAKVGGFGLLNQLAPDAFPDSSGAEWTDIFTDPKLYQTAAVETLTVDLEPVGSDVPSIYADVVLADGPVGYWRLGQTGGLVAPSATGNEDIRGLYIGLGANAGPANLGQPGPRPSTGFYGMSSDNRSAHLDGDTTYVTVTDTPELDITGELTMEAWIKLDEYPEGNGGIIAKYQGSGDERGYNLYVNLQSGGVGALGMVISPDGSFGSAADMVDDTPLPIGEWVHVVGVFKPDDFMKLYVNGELVHEETEAADNIPSSIYSNTADLWLGAQFSSSSDFRLPGQIDEAAVYNRALTAAEIQSHYLAATQLPGDFNRDGLVNLADYAVWRNSLGQTGDGLMADADHSGIVGVEDYEIWKSFFSSAVSMMDPSSVAAVPTPPANQLAFALALLACVHRVFSKSA
ncbi:LamG domain-containing protein [Aeoliella sp.]|uniref:LamG domain-containing protein n=1 Tax=Aeoliella sp. TaxID=2795800 RepID=UPI003CCC06FB